MTQEPTYKEMVVMYKRDPKKSVAALDPTHASAINDRGIFLRTYRNIPMVQLTLLTAALCCLSLNACADLRFSSWQLQSDLELIFPEKKLGVRPMDFVYLAATGAIGIATLIIHFSDEVRPPRLIVITFPVIELSCTQNQRVARITDKL
ncbi:DUF3754 domain-containing protein, partial [Rhizobium leguminosarum]|nr:DUF3754 domain-containing protein [Rhizobium leguminosarum]